MHNDALRISLLHLVPHSLAKYHGVVEHEAQDDRDSAPALSRKSNCGWHILHETGNFQLIDSFLKYIWLSRCVNGASLERRENGETSESQQATITG